MSRIHTSILTCTYNMCESLEAALVSAREQLRPGVEHLVLDDGSTDATQTLLKNADHPQVRFFRFPKRRGLTVARNFLLSKANGDYLSILDADDSFLGNKVSTHARYMDAHPEVGMVWGRAFVGEKGQGKQHLRVIPEMGFEPGWDLTTPYSAVHSATTWRKSAVQSVGGYDADWTAVEAVELYLRIGDRWQQHFCDGFVAYKNVDPHNDFRCYLRDHGKALSHQLLLRTLKRRYPSNYGKLFERLKSQPPTFDPIAPIT